MCFYCGITCKCVIIQIIDFGFSNVPGVKNLVLIINFRIINAASYRAAFTGLKFNLFYILYIFTCFTVIIFELTALSINSNSININIVSLYCCIFCKYIGIKRLYQFCSVVPTIEYFFIVRRLGFVNRTMNCSISFCFEGCCLSIVNILTKLIAVISESTALSINSDGIYIYIMSFYGCIFCKYIFVKIVYLCISDIPAFKGLLVIVNCRIINISIKGSISSGLYLNTCCTFMSLVVFIVIVLKASALGINSDGINLRVICCKCCIFSKLIAVQIIVIYLIISVLPALKYIIIISRNYCVRGIS
jgi:hypothetical protein